MANGCHTRCDVCCFLNQNTLSSPVFCDVHFLLCHQSLPRLDAFMDCLCSLLFNCLAHGNLVLKQINFCFDELLENLLFFIDEAFYFLDL